MATVEELSLVAQIGETAGAVWQLLDQDGPQKMSRLVKQVDAPRDAVMQAVGWLAREDKIRIEEESRSRVIYLA